MKRISLIVALALFLVVAVPNSEVFGTTIEEIKEEIIVNGASDLISDATPTESVVSDIESDDENALVFDGNEVLINVSADSEDNITLSDGLGDDISIGLPDSLTANTEVLTGNDGTVLYHNEGKAPEVELAVQAIADEVFEGIRLSMIINDSSADHEYEFDFNIAENSKIVTSSEYFNGKVDTGELFIVDENNVISRIIEEPWAKDANGESIDTKYVINGDTIKQVVDFNEDTAFPVVADPTIVEDLKCAATIVLFFTGVKAATVAGKAVIKVVQKAGSVAKAAKAIYTVVKLKIQGASKKEMAKALTKLGLAIGTAESLLEYVLDIIGVSDIKKYCVIVAY
jgi:hypothetical protein